MVRNLIDLREIFRCQIFMETKDTRLPRSNQTHFLKLSFSMFIGLRLDKQVLHPQNQRATQDF